jgi:hypothetical protein
MKKVLTTRNAIPTICVIETGYYGDKEEIVKKSIRASPVRK